MSLRKFYIAYNEWLKLGAPDNPTFSRSYGLCHNLTYWALHNSKDPVKLSQQLGEQFRKVGLKDGCPFNETYRAYDTERGEMHLNPKRIAWVEKHAKPTVERAPILRDFYRAYWKWVKAGAPEDNADGFCAHVGLCSNIQYWRRVGSVQGHKLRAKMAKQFRDANLDDFYPFDNRGEGYHATRIKYTNPRRMAWVKEHM